MLDKHLVHALISGKYVNCGSADLSLNHTWLRSHGSTPPSLKAYLNGHCADYLLTGPLDRITSSSS
jgi:hypothetical protein